MNRSLHFGEGLFETILWKENNPKIPLHYKRLSGSARFLSIPCPDYETFLAQITAAVGGGGCDEKKYVKYLLYSEGGKGFWQRAEGFRWEVIVRELPSRPSRVSLCISPYGRHSADPVARHKTISYLFNVIVRREACERGFDDGIVLNERGEVCEVSSANVIIVKGSRLLTPSRDCGLLYGTTLEYLSSRIEVVEERLTAEDLFSADGVFVINSIMGAVRVESIEGKRIKVDTDAEADILRALEDVL